MRVLQVIESLTRGGAERLVVELAREYARLGHESRVVCLSSPGPWAERLAAEGLYAGCLGKRRGFDPSIIGKVNGLIDELASDVVNTHLFTSNLWTRLAALRRRDWGLVVTLHNVDTWRRLHHRALDCALVRVADHYVAVGEEVERYWRGHGVPGARMTLIRNAVDWNGRKCPRPLANGAALIRACGRLEPQKGFDVLVEAAGVLAGGRRGFVVEILGGGPEKERLQRLIETRGLRDRVKLVGERDGREFIAAADILVLPSRREGLPLVLLEALHAARPVVASRLPSLVAVVADGREALLVEPDSPMALARAIERLMADPVAARAMAAQGRALAGREFSIERAASSYIDVFTRVGRRRAK